MKDTGFVFTDASFEVNDSATAGFGGALVIVSPNGTCLSHFGFVLERDFLSRLNPIAQKTIIHKCEFLAVAIALKSWKDDFTAKQIVSFIDNNAVRASLISAKATGEIANRLLESVLQNGADNGLMMWFARVPSKSNIADDPPRGCCKLLDKLGSKEIKIDVQHWLDFVVPS